MLVTVGTMIRESFDHPLWFVDFGRDHGAVIHAAESSRTPGPSIEHLRRRYRAVVSRAGGYLHATFTVGIGPERGSISALFESYDRALDATDFRFRLGSGRVIVATEIQPPAIEYRFPRDDVRHLVEELRLGHTDRALELGKRIVVDASNARYADFRFAVESLLRTMRQEFGDRGDISPESGAVIRRLANSVDTLDTAAAAVDAFHEAFTALARSADTQRRRRTKALIQQIHDYVDENLTDPNLNVDLIADHVGLSTNYLRDLFRKVAGESVSSVVVEKRMERIKERLLESDDAAKDIATDTGFQNSNYFFTLFKRQTGMTPNEFRRTGRSAD
jgi:AraC-like DNA-binding protein